MVTLEQVDSDFYAKRRINRWLETNADVFGDYNGDVDIADLADLLLRFEKFLQTEELRRMKD
jgi:hypothetical protein